jgi:uncharacterized repeat protein (TIGR03803 family)
MKILHVAIALLALMVFAPLAPAQTFTYTDLYEFGCASGGCAPYDFGSLTLGIDGYYYGTTSAGGEHDLGTVFKVLPGGTGYIDLWDFDGRDTGSAPYAALSAASDGNFYGTTAGGGTNSYGTVFRIGSTAGSIKVLHSFTPAEADAYGVGSYVPPVQAVMGGTLYGVNGVGPYTVTLAGVYKAFTSKVPGSVLSPLAYIGTVFYGVSQSGGTDNMGTVFRMTTTGGITIIHSFDGTDGSTPDGPLILGSDGNLYGTTAGGGTNGSGEVFQMTTAGHINWTFPFDSFVGGFACNTDGGAPGAGLTAGPGGLLYGVNGLGGAGCWGTIFEVKPGTTANFKKLFDFVGNSTCATCVPDGNPSTTLVLGPDGALYGLTEGSDAPNPGASGNFYRLAPDNPILNVGLCCNYHLVLDQPVIIEGLGLGETAAVTIGGVPAEFTPGSGTYLTAQLPSAAVDGPVIVTVTNPAGGEEELDSQQIAHIDPVITNLDPSSGPVGTMVHITGGGFAGTRQVRFAGKLASFTVLSPSAIEATVPAGAKKGKATVNTPNGVATSPEPFTVN